MITMLRHEASTGAIDDLGHVRTADMLADVLTKHSVKPDTLVKAVNTGILPNCDASPLFRTLLRHKAYMVKWICENLQDSDECVGFLGVPCAHLIHAYFAQPRYFRALLARSNQVDDWTVSGHTHDTIQPYAWHSHTCEHCNSTYTHFHAVGDDMNAHTHPDDYCCSNHTCDSFYGNAESMSHNPYHTHN